ncbi:hypothetical protein Naga_100173g9 [Nannochloropsis gaditana]|uniref:Uncharacterized protein n=1 Tax=Nannochloropsis gaditana TaxID=72520 RepID=W7U2N4_9STRA|nr:hypothetical protein Naga_100173g9 [Nannochloropsis gaditana]
MLKAGRSAIKLIDRIHCCWNAIYESLHFELEVTTDDLFTSGKCELSLDEIDVTGRIRRQIIIRSMKYPEKLSE